ncbi:DUF1080 domain-containing protein [Paenibacillus sp. WQ 127069]|uniref:DUF1080 domain-containing protein n=1 Tax=Paenibacillus baimaensis TaxID=2982185 RepID=A0ABT2US59_9BACL|nr:family 16 glycoside hydrolase [Paenibacillus sp. WQ 127069]MCU6797494.1 DUF1080 domain-containing protein [Paenibacillus sp. WQ 127069]
MKGGDAAPESEIRWTLLLHMQGPLKLHINEMEVIVMLSFNFKKQGLAALLLLSLLLSLLPVPTAVLAVDYSREQVSLNGVWDFYPNNGTTASNITVPSYWDETDFGYPAAWQTLNFGVYKRSFTVPSSMSGKEIFLNLDRISVIGKVLVNGIQVGGETTGGYVMMSLPYKLDITALVTAGSSNTLEIRTWGKYALPADAVDSGGRSLFVYGVDDQSWGQGRGISGDVFLTAAPKMFISDTFVTPDLKKNTDPSDDTITLKVTVTNSTSSSQTVTLKNNATLVGGSLEKSFADQTVTIGANSSQMVSLTDVAWTNAKYWWTDDPKLYNLNSSLVQGAMTIDSYVTRFGFRQFNVNTNYFQLNGVKTNLRGDALQFGWHAFHTHGPTTSASQTNKDANIKQVKLLMDEWKNTNMNAFRTHVGGAIKELYDYADEIGLLVIDEAPIWQPHNSITTPANTYLTEWVQRWINSYKNHPSVIMWSGSNECWDTNCASVYMPTINNAISSVDSSRPIMHDGNNAADEDNVHYTGGYPGAWLNNGTMYGLYTNGTTKPKGEGESYTPSQGWPLMNADGTLSNTTGGNNYADANIVSQAVRHRAVGRMTRAMRYAGLADIRSYANWRYSYEVLEDTLYPIWDDPTAPGLKPTIIDRPMFNVFDTNRPAFIKSDSYDYWKNTFAPVAAFDKNGDKDNRIGVNLPLVSAGSTQSRTIVVYNDEQQNGTNVNVAWEAGYLNPADNSYTSFQTGSFVSSVPYGGKTEQAISFAVPTGLTGSRWLQLKLTTSKGSVTKFQETNTIAAINSIPAPKLYTAPVINAGTVSEGNQDQLRKIKLINKGGGLSTNWTVSGQGGWLNLVTASGNLRGEQEIFYTIDTTGLNSNTNYSKTLTFTEAGGTSASVIVSFKTGSLLSTLPTLSDNFESGTASGWTPTAGNWSIVTDGTKVYQQSDSTAVDTHALNGSTVWSNYEVSAKVKADAFDSGGYAGVGLDARYQDSNNSYSFQYYKQTGQIKIQKKVAGTITSLAAKSYTFNTGTWYTMKAVVNGSNLEFWINGVLELTVVDSSLATGQIGLNAHRANAKFDDVSMQSLVLLSDSFESGTATGWTPTTGTWAVVTDGTKVYQQSDSTAADTHSLNGSIAWTNYAISTKVKADVFDSGTFAGIGLDARYQDSNNLYNFQYYKQSGEIKIQKKVGGTWTTLVSKSYTFNTGTWYTMKAVVNGSTLELWVNGTKELTTTDSSFSSGKVGLNAHRANAKFDDVTVQ